MMIDFDFDLICREKLAFQYYSMENVMQEKSIDIIFLIYQIKFTLLFFSLFSLVNQFCKNIKSKLFHNFFLFITFLSKYPW